MTKAAGKGRNNCGTSAAVIPGYKLPTWLANDINISNQKKQQRKPHKNKYLNNLDPAVYARTGPCPEAERKRKPQAAAASAAAGRRLPHSRHAAAAAAAAAAAEAATPAAAAGALVPPNVCVLRMEQGTVPSGTSGLVNFGDPSSSYAMLSRQYYAVAEQQRRSASGSSLTVHVQAGAAVSNPQLQIAQGDLATRCVTHMQLQVGPQVTLLGVTAPQRPLGCVGTLAGVEVTPNNSNMNVLDCPGTMQLQTGLQVTLGGDSLAQPAGPRMTTPDAACITCKIEKEENVESEVNMNIMVKSEPKEHSTVAAVAAAGTGRQEGNTMCAFGYEDIKYCQQMFQRFQDDDKSDFCFTCTDQPCAPPAATAAAAAALDDDGSIELLANNYYVDDVVCIQEDASNNFLPSECWPEDSNEDTNEGDELPDAVPESQCSLGDLSDVLGLLDHVVPSSGTKGVSAAQAVATWGNARGDKGIVDIDIGDANELWNSYANFSMPCETVLCDVACGSSSCEKQQQQLVNAWDGEDSAVQQYAAGGESLGLLKA